MDTNTLIQSASAILVAVGLKLAGAVLLFIVGRWLIGLAVRMMSRALARLASGRGRVTSRLKRWTERTLTVKSGPRLPAP